MVAQANRKVKEGKLVKVQVEYDDVIRKIKITGDFFLYPEEILERIEKSMLGMEKDASAEAIASKIRGLVEAEEAQMVGVGAESLASVIKEALK